MSARTRILALAVCLVTGSGGSANGAETASFLKISPGARPVGMGNAFTAVADDLNSLAWNPAGMAQAPKREAAFMHAQLFADTQYDFVGYAHPLSRHKLPGTLAFGVARLSQQPIGGRDSNRRRTGSFTAADTVYQAAYSRSVLKRTTNLGVSVKYLQSQLADTRTNSYAFDLGIQRTIRSSKRPLTLGVSAMNIGPGMRYLDETNDLPLTFSVGAGLRAFSSVLITADVRHRPNSQQTTYGLGSEFALLSTLTFRAGYGTLFGASRSRAGGKTPLEGIGMGMGLKVGRVILDYSLAPSGELGNAQRVSLSTKF